MFETRKTKKMFFIILTALLWGVTNPLLKRYSAGFADDAKQQQQQSDSSNNEGGGALRDVKFLLSRPKYLITQIVNLSGTVVFAKALESADMSIASVAANALALAITCVVSALLGDSKLTLRGIVGIFFVTVGLGMCTYESMKRTEEREKK